MKKQIFMTLTFFLMLGFGSCLGRVMTGMNVVAAPALGLILAFVGMFVGMVLTHLHLYSKLHLSETRRHQMEEKRAEFDERIRKLVEKQNALGDEAVLAFSKSVSQKVANRILAKHFDDLANDSKRAPLFKSVDAIIESEIAQAALELGGRDQNDSEEVPDF